MSVKFDNYLKEQLKDPEFRKEYERLEIESKLEEVEHEAEETTVRYTSEEVIESILEEVKRHNNRAIKKKENIKYYMSLPYTYIVQERNDDTGHYFYGKILEFDGCQSTGSTIEELYENLMEAMESYIELKLERNLPIPEPGFNL